MKNLKLSAAMSVLLGVMLSGLGAYAQSTPPPTNSAPGSRTSDTHASSPTASGVSSPTVREGSPLPTAPEVARRALTDVRATDTTGGKPQDPIKACAAAAAELEASRRLIDLIERENRLLKERLETETRTTAVLTELNSSRKAESDALKTALIAKSETLTAKDEVIAAQQKLIDSLKTKKSSPWKRLGDILIGVAAGMVLR